MCELDVMVYATGLLKQQADGARGARMQAAAIGFVRESAIQEASHHVGRGEAETASIAQLEFNREECAYRFRFFFP